MTKEIRAAWAAWPGGHVDLSNPTAFHASSAQPWDEALPSFADAGYTHLMPCVGTAVAPWWNSTAVTPHPPVPGRHDGGDYLMRMARAAATSRIELHPWIVCWQLSPGFLSPTTVMDVYRAEGRLAISADGTEQKMLCPSDERNRAQMLNILLEMTGYNVAGVHLDYIRFEDVKGSFTPAARARFETWTGKPVTAWPADVLGPRAEEWHIFNREVITSFVREAREALNKARPGFKLSAAVFPTQASALLRAQNWPLWVREGLLDWVMPMTYTESLSEWVPQVEECDRLTPRNCKLLPSIRTRVGAPRWWDTTDIHMVPDATTQAKLDWMQMEGMDGYATWQWGRGLPLPI